MGNAQHEGMRPLRKKVNVGNYTVVKHERGQVCPRCGRLAFCDDCGICESCAFAPPEVSLPEPPHSQSNPACRECGGTVLHQRTCSVTKRALAS